MKRYRNTRLSTDAVETIDFGGDMYGDDAELNLSDGSELDAEGENGMKMLTQKQKLWKWEQTLIISKKKKTLIKKGSPGFPGEPF